MKNLHKLMVTLFTAVIILSFNSYGQEDEYTPKESVLKKAYEVCPVSLNSDIQGIVEGGIDKLNEIAEKNIDPSIRFKAHLASIYLNFYDIIDIRPKFDFDHEYIYKQITGQLENNLVVNN